MDDKARELIDRFRQVRTLPQIISRLTRLINDEHSTLQDFEEVIRMDPALVARLLTLVNSSYFGLSRKVDSISRAVALLGMKNLHNIAVTDSLKSLFVSGREKDIFSPRRLWLHCTASGICSKMIAERIFSINGDDAYLCGIMHDIGLIVEYQVAKEPFLQAFAAWVPDGPAITASEQEFLGTDHCRIGFLLAEEWHMAESICQAIRSHHSQDDEVEPQSPDAILRMSEYILCQLDLAPKEGAVITLPERLATHVRENMEEYRVVAEDLPEELEQVQAIYDS